ncbi:Diaminopimelate decarboxylase [Aquicella siphonis]|uniref:Diaminopimelate decarboxylase n=1 Tax=Aquicella siphonis TaxID=254247 RepID=A0A5E4PLC9_9COXI|nr:hypothetical protein [Aquicella siphonis]VVC77221.1 Diaminopimelate decarboxylase [Aquicella siphonis]
MRESENHFSGVSAVVASEWAERFGTPLFIMDEAGVLQRFDSLRQAVQTRYPHSIVSVSYKTNCLKGLLARLHQAGAHAEVVSGLEYAIADEIRLPGQRIIFNGPMKTREEIEKAIKDQAIINCDHDDEIELIAAVAQRMAKTVSIGLRIYFSDTQSSWNRFGFQVDKELAQAETRSLVDKILKSPYLKLGGVHMHIGTNIRDLRQFRQMGQCLGLFASALKSIYQIELEWIDVGGGLAGISPLRADSHNRHLPLPDAEAYANAVIAPLLPYLHGASQPPLLIFEPGRTLFEAYGALLTRVVGRRHQKDSLPAVILDAGINTLSTSYRYDFPIRCFADTKSARLTQLWGPTCNQADQLHTPLALPELSVNDLLMFYGVGSYCMAFSYSFIRFRPGVILWRGGSHAEWLRLPESLLHNSMIGHIPESIAREARQ